MTHCITIGIANRDPFVGQDLACYYWGFPRSNMAKIVAFLIFVVVTTTFNYFSITSFSLFLSYPHQAWATSEADIANKGLLFAIMREVAICFKDTTPVEDT